MFGDPNLALSDAQWDALNNERVQLIEKRLVTRLTPRERLRLQWLQHVADVHLDRVAPVPQAPLQQMLAGAHADMAGRRRSVVREDGATLTDPANG
jgi:hypothetical protein